MSYIGRQLNNLSDRVKLDSLTASATATYNLLLNTVAYVPSSAESLTVSLNGVIQAPQSSYTVSGSQITFASALTSSDSIDFILAERSITLQTPSAGSVGTSQLAADAVNGDKIADDSISDEHLDPTAITGQTEKTSLVDADKFLISDSADSNALKYVQKSNLPSGTHELLQQVHISSAVSHFDTNAIFSTSYRTYVLFGYHLRPSTGANLRMRFLEVGGSLMNGSNYKYNQSYAKDGGTGRNYLSGTYFQIADGCGYSVDNGGTNFTLYVNVDRGTSSDSAMQIWWNAGGSTDDGNSAQWGGGGWYDGVISNDPPEKLRFYWSSGNITNGRIAIYGIKGT